METVTKKTATNLTSESVSILAQQFALDENGEEVQIGENHRCAYENSERGRTLLAESEPEEIVAEVMAVWGNTPTVDEPEIPEFDDADSGSTEGTTAEAFWDEMALAIEEGVNEV